MRLNRYLAQAGLGSRRSCDQLIAENRVQINGVIADLGASVDAGDQVRVDGQPVEPPTSTPHVWMLYKPAGVVSTAHDPQGRRTVVQLAQEQGIEARLYPVGRLDRDTTGLLLLTDHGDLCHRLTHPSWEIDKEYLATVAAPLAEADLEKLRHGIDLEDGRTAPCSVDQQTDASGARVRLVLHEGRNRQVRRMLQAVGRPVRSLHRVRVGSLTLGTLRVGELRQLDATEQQELERSLDLPPTPPDASSSA